MRKLYFLRSGLSLVCLIGLGIPTSKAFGADLLMKQSSRPLQAESTMNALEPWETPIEGFFVRSHHGVPVVGAMDNDSWTLVIDGLVDKPLTLTLADLKKMPQNSLHAVLECSGNGRASQSPPVSGVQWQRGAIGNAEWGGVKLSTLLTRVGVQSAAKFARIEGGDLPPFSTVPSFIRSVPLARMQDDRTLLAWSMNRESMPILHGGPLRLILPGWYAENWIKWLTHITLTETEDHGFYMKKGYRMPKSPVKPGEVWDSSTGGPIEELLVQSLIVSPQRGARLAPGKIQVHGKAFSGSGNISKVELSIDQGKTWQLTELSPPHEDGGWQEFHKTLPVVSTQPLVILSRATDSRGNQQPMDPSWNPGGYLRNSVDSVSLGLNPVSELIAPNVDHPLITSRCLTCHTRELIESQRLSLKQWEAVLKKMETFGVKLESEERQSLLASLSTSLGQVATHPWVPQMTKYETEMSQMSGQSGKIMSQAMSPKTGTIQVSYAPGKSLKKAALGALLFTQYCSSCHGSDGEGKVGPRLRGRLIPYEEFWSTVQKGKRAMPPFASVLKPQQILDIHEFIQK